LINPLRKGSRLDNRISLSIHAGRIVIPPFLPSCFIRAPGTIRVGIDHISGKDVDTVAILSLQCFRGSDPLPERTSGKGAKNQDHRLGFKKVAKSISFEGLAQIACF
jgi:hypothetical protein